MASPAIQLPSGDLSAYLRLAGMHQALSKYPSPVKRVDWGALSKSSESIASARLVVFDGSRLLSSADDPAYDRLIESDAALLPLGIDGDGTGQVSRILVRALETTGTLSVANENSFRVLAEQFGEKKVSLTGSYASLARAKAIRGSKRRPLYVPPHSRTVSESERSAFFELYRWLLEETDAVYLPADVGGLELGAVPGTNTIFFPHAPHWHLRAIASASHVITFDVDTVNAARAMGTPAVLLTKKSLEEMKSELSKFFASPPFFSEKEHAQVSRVLVDHVVDSLPSTKKAMPLRRVTKRSTKVNFGIVVSRLFAPQAQCFLQNLLEFEGINRVYLLELEDGVAEELKVADPKLTLTRYSLSDLWSPEELALLKEKPIATRAYMSKSRLLLKILKESDAPTFYSDVDFHFFREPSDVVESFGENDVLLFPHHPSQPTRKFGIFNAGLMVVKRGAEPVLEQWTKMNLFECSPKADIGYYFDQTWLDYLPTLFKNVGIYRELDQDIAEWNIHSLGVKLGDSLDGELKLPDGRTVRSYHSANVVPEICEIKDGWDHLVVSLGTGAIYREHEWFAKVAYRNQQDYWKTLLGLLTALGRSKLLSKISFATWKRWVWGGADKSGSERLRSVFFKLGSMRRGLPLSHWRDQISVADWCETYRGMAQDSFKVNREVETKSPTKKAA